MIAKVSLVRLYRLMWTVQRSHRTFCVAFDGTSK